MQISHKLYAPTSEQHDGIIILPNESTATLDGYHGARAQDVATATGYVVLAYERPFSGEGQSYSIRTRRHVRNNANDIFDTTAEQLNDIIKTQGLAKCYIAGHSVGTIDAIGLTANKRIKCDGLIVTDPLGLRQAPRLAEITEYLSYQIFAEKNKPTEDAYENTQPQRELSRLETPVRMLGELLIYGAYASTPQALVMLEQIALEQPKTPVGVVLPEHTFTIKPEAQVAVKESLEKARGSGGAPFQVSLMKGAYHSRFNDYKYFGDVVSQHIDAFMLAA